MKQKVVLCVLLFTHVLVGTNCHVCVEAKWDNLEQSSQKEKKFGGKLMLIGSITFRKQCKECIKIDKLVLKWHGKPIDSLCGSLYRKLPEKEFKPIQENLICDASWNKNTQSLILNFENQQTLNAFNIFYLVLTIPDELENTLKAGHFMLPDTSLPDQINFTEKKLDLALAP